MLNDDQIYNRIYTLKAQEFRIASVTHKLSDPGRMFIILFFHKDFPTLVRVRVIFREALHSDIRWPEFGVETVDKKYEVLEAAEATFETKALSFIKSNYPEEIVTDG